jgi:hypothetical protein
MTKRALHPIVFLGIMTSLASGVVTSDIAGSHVTLPGEPAFGVNVDGVALLAGDMPNSETIDDLIDPFCTGALIGSAEPHSQWDVANQPDLDIPLVNANNDTANGGWVTPPVASIVAPVEDAVLSGTVTIQVDARDVDTLPGDLTLVEVQQVVNGEPIASIGAADFNVETGYYELAWDTDGWDGTHQILAVATDSDGNMSSTTSVVVANNVDVVVDNVDDPPIVEVINPASGSTVNGTVVLEAHASDGHVHGVG